MLASASTIALVAKVLEERNVRNVVIDPVSSDLLAYLCSSLACLISYQVMVATTGAKLLPSEALRELRTHILPQATLVTPNIPEARLLLADAGHGDMPLETVADLEVIAKTVQSLGSQWALVKGGHAPFRRDHTIAKTDAEREIVVDILYGEGRAIRIQTEFQDSKNTHGTGCSLACE